MRQYDYRHNYILEKRKQRAFTLVEVVASVALLAVLLTASLMAYGRHASQIRQAHTQLAAINALDEVITDWMRYPSAYDGRTSGYCGAQSQFRWQVAQIPDVVTDTFGAQVLRWQVYDASDESLVAPVAQLDVLEPTRNLTPTP